MSVSVNRNSHREIVEQRISVRIDLEVLNSVDHNMSTSTRKSECVSVSVNSNFGIRHGKILIAVEERIRE